MSGVDEHEAGEWARMIRLRPMLTFLMVPSLVLES